ncbi:MBL fold metallo-hydrolase [Bradyrhizobium sp. sBnM-33]
MQQQPTAGRLLQNLAAAEIKPEEVDTILITHAHPDHLWGWLTQVTPSGPFQTPNL